MDEFALIHRYFGRLTPPRGDVALGIGDDAALLQPPRGHELAMTTDTLIAGHALSRDMILVTGNEAHFRDVPGLTVINWRA